MTLLKTVARSLLCVYLFTSSIAATAQSEVYKLGGSDAAALQSLSDKHENVFKQTIAALPSEHKKELLQLYKARWENAKQKFEQKKIYTSPAASAYLNQLVKEIVVNNPTLSNLPLNCYFSRSGNPNASYVGEGIILINMGLFNRLQNESQLAFVICHEIAHQYLKHSENTITNYVARLNSKEVQHELKSIKNSKYRRNQPLEELTNSITYDTRRHVRQNETEADSLAVELLKHTRFDAAEVIATLKILDEIDTDTISTNECLKKLFNSEGYPFQQKWISREEGLLGGHAKLQSDKFEDSLKTHPDCKLRISKLEPVISKLNSGSKNIIDSATFRHYTRLFRYEVIEYAYSSDNYGRSLYYTLELLQRMPSDPYLIANIGRLLNGMYFAQKDHRLNNYVDLPAPSYPSHYNQLLQFIQNLYLENIASINYHFLTRYQEKLKDYPPFMEAYKTSTQVAEK
jgi:Zn-dependent protease with chaperone function